MTKPIRIQRKREKGWNGAVAAGNGLPVAYVHRPLKYGNPFTFPPKDKQAQAFAVQDYEAALVNDALPYSCEEVRRDLKGKNLGCYCSLEDPCHADVLLRIANEEPE